MGTEITPKREGAMAPLDVGAALEVAAGLGKDGIEVVERLYAIQKEERSADAAGQFVTAMAKFRGMMPPIIKTATGQHGVKKDGTRTKGMYAPLDAITPVLDPIAAECGLSYRFDREVVEGRPDDYVVCIVTHAAGHEVKSRYPAPAGQQNKGTSAIQAIAVGESYARRYVLCAAFGITSADPDSDGNVGAPAGPAITDNQALEIESLIEAAGMDDASVGRFLNWAESERVATIPASLFGQAVSLLGRKIKAAR